MKCVIKLMNLFFYEFIICTFVTNAKIDICNILSSFAFHCTGIKILPVESANLRATHWGFE